jgi:hypothetical protein
MRRLAIAETVPNGRELRTLSSADAQLDFRRQLQLPGCAFSRRPAPLFALCIISQSA